MNCIVRKQGNQNAMLFVVKQQGVFVDLVLAIETTSFHSEHQSEHLNGVPPPD
jgi:hypothetical protein